MEQNITRLESLFENKKRIINEMDRLWQVFIINRDEKVYEELKDLIEHQYYPLQMAIQNATLLAELDEKISE